MNLATQLLQKVQEAKQAEDEMAVPKYDDMKTPNNHVGNSSNATKETKAKGLGDRVEKKPTADVGTPHFEKGRKMDESQNPKQDLRMHVDGGLFHFSHPSAADQVYSIEWNQEFQRFLKRTMQRTRDTGKVFDLLQMWYEEGEGNDPQNMVGLNASKGITESMSNPIMQALGAKSNGRQLRITSPDGSAGMVVPLSPAINKAINGFITSPDARANTAASADRLFKMLGAKVPGVQAVEPEAVGANQTKQGGTNQYQGDASNIDTSGLSMAPMTNSIGEAKSHKTAAGEMKSPAIKKESPAKKAKTRTKHNDAPKNKGNPGSSKEEKGQKKQQFTMTPKDFKGGENEHKSMKKMHETVAELETLLGRTLDI